MPSGRSFCCHFIDEQGPHSRQHAQTYLWILILLFLGYMWPWGSPFDALELSFSIGSNNANHRHKNAVKEIIRLYNVSYPSAWHNVDLAVLSRPTLCSPMGYSAPGSSVHEILQARRLEWIAISFSRGSSQPRQSLYHWAIREAHAWHIADPK